VANYFSEKLTSDGWVVIPPEAFGVEGLDVFGTYWENLPADEYVTDGSRLRRFGRCHMTPESMRWLPSTAFVQSKQFNAVFGDRERVFAPLVSEFTDSRGLHSITRTLFDTLAPLLGGAVEVGIHQISVVPSREPTQVVPEGAHRDGFHYVTISLIRLEHIRADSAFSSVIDPHTKQALFCRRLTRPLECLVIDDRRWLHDCSPVIAEQLGVARRDVMIQTWSPARRIGSDLGQRSLSVTDATLGYLGEGA
jgi:hypothetical protein